MELYGKKLLILGGTSASYDLVRNAKAMGIYTIVTDNNETGESIFIEANLCKGSVEIHEFNNGPLFGEDTKKILDEVYRIK